MAYDVGIVSCVFAARRSGEGAKGRSARASYEIRVLFRVFLSAHETSSVKRWP